MAEYTYVPYTEHTYPNLTLEQRLCDGSPAGYRLTPNEGYVMYRTNANDMEMDENGEWYPVVYYYKYALLPRTYNFNNFTWVAVLRSTVDEDMIFSVGDKPEIM